MGANVRRVVELEVLEELELVHAKTITLNISLPTRMLVLQP